MVSAEQVPRQPWHPRSGVDPNRAARPYPSVRCCGCAAAQRGDVELTAIWYGDMDVAPSGIAGTEPGHGVSHVWGPHDLAVLLSSYICLTVTGVVFFKPIPIFSTFTTITTFKLLNAMSFKIVITTTPKPQATFKAASKSS